MWPFRKRKQRSVSSIGVLPSHESAVRRMYSNAHQTEYVPLKTFDDAKQHPDGCVIVEGDDGGTIFATCPMRLVTAEEQSLHRLAEDLDAITWRNNSGFGIYYEVKSPGAGVVGGMGGGLVRDGVWVHPELVEMGMESEIEDVLTRGKPAIDPAKKLRDF